jgi:hypothetical protein
LRPGTKLQNRRLQVRFLSHLPARNPELKRRQTISTWRRFRACGADDANGDANWPGQQLTSFCRDDELTSGTM